MKRLIPIFLLICLSYFVAAIPPMTSFSLPCAFYGEVSYNGEAISDGCFIITKINGIGNSGCEIKNSRYGEGSNTCIVISEQDKVNVEFYLQGIKIGEHEFNDKDIINLDFELAFSPDCDVTPTGYCGDGTCNNGETCSSCSGDCGTCGSPGGGGGSSGGSGSGSSGGDTIDEENEVINLNYDDSGFSELSSREDNKKETPGITGGVVGLLQSKKGASLIFVLLVVILIIGMIVLNKKKATPKNG